LKNKKENEEQFRETKNAYEILSDTQLRKDYNKYIYSLYFDSTKRYNNNNQNNNFEINSNFSSYDNSNNSYGYVKYGQKKHNNFNPKGNEFNNRDINEDSFIVEFSMKHYLTFAFIIITFFGFIIFITRNPPNQNPYIYQNSVYIPKTNDYMLRGLITMKKADEYQLEQLKYEKRRFRE